MCIRDRFYRVRVKRDDSVVEIQICKKVFISVHGITRSKIDILVNKMKHDGEIPRDLRGIHDNCPHRMSKDTIKTVHEHISSFQSQNSHYTLKKSERIYLDESLNIKKMYNLYEGKFPDTAVSYESYRAIFNKHFNINFKSSPGIYTVDYKHIQ